MKGMGRNLPPLVHIKALVTDEEMVLPKSFEIKSLDLANAFDMQL